MIFVENKLLFIHIPRTGGVSITNSLIKSFSHRELSHCLICTNNSLVFKRHTPYKELQHILNLDNVFKFAVYRDTEKIIKSDYKLHLRHNQNLKNLNPNWRESLKISQNESFEEFKQRRWVPWLKGEDAWSHWTSNNSDFYKVNFDNLQEEWPLLMDKLDLPESTPLMDLNSSKMKIF